MHVLITGATGFVGKSLVSLLKKEGCLVRTTDRMVDENNLRTDTALNENIYFDLDASDNNYNQLLDGIDIVVHLAARVHILDDKNESNDQKYKTSNVLGTENLVKESVKRGIKRFVYISTIKVNGEKNTIEDSDVYPFKENDTPCPEGNYAISKFEAENTIRKNCENSKMDFVILRPPLVYGPGVKANFISLLNAINNNIPLPLGAVKNRRSLIYVENLAYAISVCIKHPRVINKIYLISDVDISIPELINKISSQLGKKSLLFSVPVKLLKSIGSLFGKRSMIDRLTNSLIVDNSLLRKDIDWIPPYSFDEGLTATIDWYLQEKKA